MSRYSEPWRNNELTTRHSQRDDMKSRLNNIVKDLIKSFEAKAEKIVNERNKELKSKLRA